MADWFRNLFRRLRPWHDPEGEARRERRTRELVAKSNELRELVIAAHDRYLAEDERVRGER